MTVNLTMNHHLPKLIKLGLSEREAKLYLALLEHSDVTANELQILVDIPRTKVHETLRRMVIRELCFERHSGNVKRYSPVDPHTVLSTRKKEMARQIEDIDKLDAALSKVYEKKRNQPVSVESVEVLRSREQIIQRRKSLIEECRNELLVFRKTGFEVFTLEESDQAILEAVKRIKKVRVVYEFDAWQTQERRHYITKWQKAGEESRFIRTLPTKLLIFDGIHALTLVKDMTESASEISMFLANHEVAQTFRELFEYVWNNAIPFKEFVKNHEK
jgi:sugar-specific transcriptional regulator TrmB